jgi:integrase/recombinase XerD
MKEERANRVVDISGIPSSFRSAVTEYLNELKAANRSGWTIRSYSAGLAFFFSWLKESNPGSNKLTDITKDVLSSYQLHLLSVEKKTGGKLSLWSRHSRITALSSFMSWLAKESKILINPAATLQHPRAAQRLPASCLSHREVNRLLAAPDITTHLGLRNRAILEMLYSTGIRNSELRGCKLEDFNRKEAWLTIRQGKGGKDRVVPIGKAALHFTILYLEKIRPLFAKGQCCNLFISRHGEKLHEDTVNQIIGNAAKRAGLKRTVTAHALRHSCATSMLRGRADIRHIQELLGHRSLSSTQIYTKVEIGDLKRVHQHCHPREKEAIDKHGD